MKAIVLNLAAWSVLPIMDGMAKHLSTEIPVLQVVWGRYFFMVLLSVPLTYFFFNSYLKWPSNIQIQLIRSIFLFLSTVLFFYAISILPLADSLTLMFFAPIIVTVLSAFILKEKVGLRRWIAVFIGFFGAIIISIIVPFVWLPLNFNQWLFLIGLAAAGTLGHLLLILSLNFAEASKLAPLGYFEIVTNIIIGYVYFNDFPNKWIWLGLFFIISSGVYISLRENKINSEGNTNATN